MRRFQCERFCVNINLLTVVLYFAQENAKRGKKSDGDRYNEDNEVSSQDENSEELEGPPLLLPSPLSEISPPFESPGLPPLPTLTTLDVPQSLFSTPLSVPSATSFSTPSHSSTPIASPTNMLTHNSAVLASCSSTPLSGASVTTRLRPEAASRPRSLCTIAPGTGYDPSPPAPNVETRVIVRAGPLSQREIVVAAVASLQLNVAGVALTPRVQSAINELKAAANVSAGQGVGVKQVSTH